MRTAAIFMLLVSLSMSVFADETADKEPTANKAPAVKLATAETDEFRRLRTDGFNDLYNMDYQNARGKFERMSQLVPEHPASYFYLASNFLFDELNSRRRLQIGLYSGDSFFSQSEDKIDPKVDKEFRRLVNLGLDKSKAAVKNNSKDADALYYQGSLHGLMALYETTVSRSFFSALSNGRESVSLHRKVVEIDPEFADAYLTIGTYDYIVGSLPFFVKMLARIGGISGNRERGLKELQTVIERGRYAKDDAKVTLITLYGREQKYDESLNLLGELSSKYPRNYLFKLERANMLVKLNRAEESFKLYEELLNESKTNKIGDLAHYQYGEALAGKRMHSEALEHFRDAAKFDGANAEVVTRAQLRAGQMLDLLGRRTEAVAQYDIVLGRDDVLDSHAEAKKYKKKPYAF